MAEGNKDIAGEGSGGELAVAANLLFMKFVAVSKKFPVRTLLIGDLNITPKAVEHIYGDEFLSSEDGWCHAVAPAGTALTLLAGSNQLTNAKSLGGSDHAPIVFDVAF